MPVPDPHDLAAPGAPGAVVLDQEEDDGRLALAPNSKFFLVHYAADPGSWFVGEIGAAAGVPEEDVGLWWLPKLKPDFERPGLCLHRTLQAGEPKRNAYHNAHLHLQAAGANVLPRSLGYCTGLPCRDPVTRTEGLYWVEPWNTPRPVVLGRQQKFNFDRQRYHRWLLKIMREGFIEPPPEDIVRELQQRREARIARREALLDLPDAKRDRMVQEAKDDAQRLQEAAIPVEEPVPRRPTQRSKPRSKPAPKPVVATDEDDS